MEPEQQESAARGERPVITTDPAFVNAMDAAAFLDAGYWSVDETLPSLVARNAAQWPSRNAVIDDEGRSFTFREVDDCSTSLAIGLLERGIGPGDTVGVQLPSRSEALVVAAAIQKVGGIVCPLAPVYREREVGFMLHKTRAKALVVPGTYHGVDYEGIAMSVRAALGDELLVISLEARGDRSGMVGIDQMFSREPGDLSEYAPQPDAVAAILFTSGTEAEPKAILHSSNTLLANARAVTKLLQLGPEDAIFMPSPISHGTGYGFGLLLATFLGSELALPGTWDPARAAAMIAEHRCSYAHGATPFVLDMLNDQARQKSDLSSLKYFVSGGASVAPGLAERVQADLGCDLLRLYGQTEGFMCTINRPGDSLERLESTDGRAAPGVSLAVLVDDDPVPRPIGQGEAVFKGPHRCVGFLDDAERARNALSADGWMLTGDLVDLDGDGYLCVSGRRKEVINRGGYKYSPREVEDVLSRHPAVQQIAIVRLMDARLGEKGYAFVVATEGSDPARLSVAALAEFLEEQGVAKYKWPERVTIVPDLPMTSSGKVQKFLLEQQINSGAAPAGGTL
jgi:acyl-CoA synthetase (AMP-forming)/AMP-acid ligase II